MNINKVVSLLEEKNMELSLAIKDSDKLKKDISELNKKLTALEKVKTLVIEAGQKSQSEVINYIEGVVTQALQSVFGEKYAFKIELETKRDQPEVYFYVKEDGMLLEPKSDTLGGGIIDVCSFALKMLAWSLENPQSPPVMFLDEPSFKNVSKEHLPKVAEMMKEINELLGIQIIMVTHIQELIDIADNQIQL